MHDGLLGVAAAQRSVDSAMEKLSGVMARLEGLPQEIRDIAWKAQVRLCARYRRPIARGKPATLVVTAIARELAAFIWAIARMVTPNAQPAAAAVC